MDPGKYQSLRGDLPGRHRPPGLIGIGGGRLAGSRQPSLPQDESILQEPDRKAPRQPDKAEGEREDSIPRSRDQEGREREDFEATIRPDDRREERDTL